MAPRSTVPRNAARDARAIDAAAAVYGLLSSVLRRTPRDLSLTSLAVLSTLERTGPRRITDLAAIEGVTQPTVTALVSALERNGLVERHGDPTDGRVTLVALAPVGRDYVRKRRRAATKSFAQLIGDLPAEGRAALAAAIPALDQLRQLDNDEREPAVRTPRI
jgi:DNA-binding MarR family transcriptional regulator